MSRTVHSATPTRHLSQPQQRALCTAARKGRVHRGGRTGQFPVTVLTALARKGLLTLVARPGTRAANWSYGTPTRAGMRTAAQLDPQITATTTPPVPTALAYQISDPFALVRDDWTRCADQLDRTFATAI